MNLSNHDKRLISELQKITEKISRNKKKKLSTEKLEADFGRKVLQLKERGITINDIRNEAAGTQKNTDCEKCPHIGYCPDKGTENECSKQAKKIKKGN